MSKLLISSLLLTVMLSISQADIPVHCLKHQVVGLWKAEVTKPNVTNDIRAASCGHKNPDRPKTSRIDGLDHFKPVSTVKFLLMENSTAIKIDGDKNTTGTWTLIYDEGFDIVVDDERYTNFFYYYKKSAGDKKYLSDCGKTTVGWYSNNKSERACWKGHKILAEGETEEDLIGEQTKQKYVVQPKYTIKDSSSSFLQEQESTSHFKKKRHSLRANQPLDVNSTHINNGVKYHSNFTNHSEIVHQLNQIDNKSWTAKAYTHYESKTLGELNEMAGRKGTRKIRASVLSNLTMEDVSDLPKEFDWESSLGGLKNQLRCGSCYAVATMQMLEARLKIKYNETVTLSPQHAIDCSYYTQGCGGGFPYLIELFASQYELVPESCSPYQAVNGQCSSCNVSSLDKVYKTTSFKFIGGSYGNCSMRQMMEELMANGPIVASFEPTPEFMYYGGGIFHSLDAEWITRGLEKPEWEKVDHTVLLYGWGETEHGMKYWKLRNSWGAVWGENGNFRMKRGVDESAIESLAEAADPIIVYRK